MKISIAQKNLKRILNITEKVVTRNPSLPILNNILLKTDNGRLHVSATNLEVGISCAIGAKIDEVGSVAVPARIITDFISTIEDEKLTLTTKNNTVWITSDRYKTQILAADPKDFPIIPKIKEKPMASIPAKILKNCLTSVLDAAATSESRPELAGVFMNIGKDKLTVASTDSFRLAERTAPIKASESKSFILPRSTAVELIRVSGEVEGDFEIRLGENQISFTNEDVELVSRLVDGSYPNYSRVIPDKHLSRAMLTKTEFEKSLRLAGLFSSHVSDVKLQCQNNQTLIVAKNSEKGEIETSTESLLKNEPFEVALNCHYLLDGIKNITSDKVLVEFTGAGSPLVLRPGNDQKDFVYVVMPLRS